MVLVSLHPIKYNLAKRGMVSERIDYARLGLSKDDNRFKATIDNNRLS
jgi:hypothetical protein